MTVSITRSFKEPMAELKTSDTLPLTIGELTAAWFSGNLGKKVKEAVVVKEIHGTASKVLLQLWRDWPMAICVKGGFNPAILAAHPSLFYVYRLEAEFYHYLAPTLNMRLTPTYYCGTDATTGQGIVVLSDLKAQGYTFGDPLEAWSVNRVRVGLEQLAILHARTWGAKAEDFPWFNSNFSLRNVISSLLSQEAWNARFRMGFGLLDDAEPRPSFHHDQAPLRGHFRSQEFRVAGRIQRATAELRYEGSHT
ncbi:unnamed protein product [Clonostachys rosea]|uniref:Aminoglycoside phosphotransferase domain-containing protein n=1 Tax=Bionectria ochroleuca TaxID=29856 RepID=A0ABY6V0Y6_BIOOC|nr:unnamed protein product [Clonostachys rosea]